MRFIRNLTGTLLVAGVASVAYAWTPALNGARTAGYAPASTAQQDDTKPPKQDESKPEKKEKAPKADKQQQEKANKAPKPENEQSRPEQKQQRQPAERPEQARPEQQQPKANRERPEQGHQEQGHAAAKNGRRIPDNDFHAHFGQPHHFAVRQVVTTTRIVPNQTQFVYSGYTFLFLDPWPDDWALSDDCYIDYIDGEYFLIDPEHPGVQISLSIVGGD